MNFTFEIYKCEFCSFLLFLQGNFQEKLNKLESESENKGGSYNFGRFLNFQFTTELAPQCNGITKAYMGVEVLLLEGSPKPERAGGAGGMVAGGSHRSERRSATW